ncbi:MAG: hypothetical protein FJ161_00655 [Gammaproteobacteria bacterium]|nr:hypothetical protein [Gammaproteobacteria bacterium]
MEQSPEQTQTNLTDVEKDILKIITRRGPSSDYLTNKDKRTIIREPEEFVKELEDAKEFRNKAIQNERNNNTDRTPKALLQDAGTQQMQSRIFFSKSTSETDNAQPNQNTNSPADSGTSGADIDDVIDVTAPENRESLPNQDTSTADQSNDPETEPLLNHTKINEQANTKQPVSEYDIIDYLPESTSNVQRSGFANTYIAYHRDSKGTWSAVVGAAQGLHDDPRREADNQEIISDTNENAATIKTDQYKEEFLYQMAAAIVAQQKVAELNNPPPPDEIMSDDTPPSPSIIQLGNYMTRAGLGIFGDIEGVVDNNAISVRKKIVSEWQKNGLNKDDKANLKQFIKNLGGNASIADKEIGGENGIPIYFAQHALNLERFVGFFGDTYPTELIAVANNSPHKDVPKVQKLVGALKTASRVRIARAALFTLTLGILPVLLWGISKIAHSVGLKYNRINSGLHASALEIALTQAIGGVVSGGCKSAKDRYGIVRITAQTYQDYLEKYKTTPPAFGSIAYFFLPKERKNYLNETFAKKWLNGHIQFVAESNTPGAAGIKNAYEILTTSQCNAIEKEIAKQKKASVQGSNKIDVLDAMRPKNSIKLSKLNKIKQKDIDKIKNNTNHLQAGSAKSELEQHQSATKKPKIE